MEGDRVCFRLTTTAAALGSVAEWTIGRFLGEKEHINDSLDTPKRLPGCEKVYTAFSWGFLLQESAIGPLCHGAPLWCRAAPVVVGLNPSPSPDRICGDQTKLSSGYYFPIWPRLFFSNSLFIQLQEESWLTQTSFLWVWRRRRLCFLAYSKSAPCFSSASELFRPLFCPHGSYFYSGMHYEL